MWAWLVTPNPRVMEESAVTGAGTIGSASGKRKKLRNGAVVKKYARVGRQLSMKGLRNRRLRHSLHKASDDAVQSAVHAARSELVHHQEQPGCIEAEGMEKTYRLKQDDLVESVPVAAAMSYYELTLNQLGPYSVNYSRNGRHLLLGGRKGHLASFDWRERRIACEVQVQETVRDICYLHNETMFAAAQKRYVYMYDSTGTELHRVKELMKVNVMTFLPYHFLLVTAGGYGDLGYMDVSIGRLVALHKTHLGELRVMCHNPYNAVIHLGHHNGTVTMWTPNHNKPVVKMLCHRAPLTSLAVDSSGRYMVTAGMDAQLKVWDCRQFKPLHSFFSRRPPVTLGLSQRGLLGLGYGRVCEVWRDALGSPEWSGPYLTHKLPAEINNLQFCPFEDCLVTGHGAGLSSIIVPGAGEPNFDALEINPFQTKTQRREAEVVGLLEKVPADLITLNPQQLTALDDADQDTLHKEKREAEANTAMRRMKMRLLRRKKRGRSKPQKLLARKKQIQGETKAQRTRSEQQPRPLAAAPVRAKTLPSVLDRFK